MDKKQKDTDEFLGLLRDKGVNITSLEDIYIPNQEIDYDVIAKTISNYFQEKGIDTEIYRDLSLIRNFLQLGRKMGYEKAREFIQSREYENMEIREAMRKIGINIMGIYDLVNTSADYSRAYPTLIKFLHKTTNPSIKEGVVRSLSMKNVGADVREALYKEYKKYRDVPVTDGIMRGLRWAMGNAISIVSGREDARRIIELVGDRRYGGSRNELIGFLGRRKIRESEEVLIKILNDEEEDDIGVIVKSINTLGLIKTENAKKTIEKFLEHENEHVRKKVIQSLERLER